MLGRGMFITAGLFTGVSVAGCDDPVGEAELARIAEDGEPALALAATREDAELARAEAVDDLTAPQPDPAALTIDGAGFVHVQSDGDIDGPTGTEGAWNKSGGGVTSTRLSLGRYWVFFTGWNGTYANAQVVAFGNTAAVHCKLEGTLTGSASLASAIVECYDSAGTQVDSAFKLLVDKRSGAGDHGAYTFVNSAGTVDSNRTWNSTGSAISASKTGTGAYSVTLTGQTVANVGVHVTETDNNSNRCVIGSWGTTTVNVRCFDSAGNAADTGFYLDRQTVTMIDLYSGTSTIGAHSFVSAGAPNASFTAVNGNCPQNPPPTLTTAASGNEVIVTLPAAEFPGGGSNAKFNVLPLVTAHGSAGDQCLVRAWNVDSAGTATVTIRCFDKLGAVINANSAGKAFAFSISNEWEPFC
ncbi:hypothetical protein [Nannocystis punicea]|uniref:Ig-like domain-containing protein n=1 Tax=Nannocystis punicea TaxID=2995304 RepID=A0ABY7GV92_9BACT|nr:hypothetical protein [Nannocystis poenicansa]WAS90744.1 hypothetical protein O0S08_31540 [Nannocystis poenicansa]